MGISKKSGEATMKPMYFQDFASIEVTGVCAGQTSILVSTAEEEGATVAFGPSPTYGELGFGEAKKSSVKPSYVDSLAGCSLLSIAMGLGTGVVLVDTSAEGGKLAEAARAKLEKGEFPVYNPPEGSSGGGGGGGGGGGKRKAEEGSSGAGGKKKAK